MKIVAAIGLAVVVDLDFCVVVVRGVVVVVAVVLAVVEVVICLGRGCRGLSATSGLAIGPFLFWV